MASAQDFVRLHAATSCDNPADGRAAAAPAHQTRRTLTPLQGAGKTAGLTRQIVERSLERREPAQQGGSRDQGRRRPFRGASCQG